MVLGSEVNGGRSWISHRNGSNYSMKYQIQNFSATVPLFLKALYLVNAFSFLNCLILYVHLL
jgi:hypothetical protein